MTVQLTSPLPATSAAAALQPARAGVQIVDVHASGWDQWRSLEERIGSPCLVNSAEWTQLWLKHYGDLVPHRMAVFNDGHNVAGMCLVTNGVGQHEGPFAVKTLHIGTAGDPDSDSVCVEFNRLLVEPDQRRQFARHLMREVQQDQAWECFALDGMHPDDAQAFFDLEAPASVNEVQSYYCDLNRFREATGEPWRIFGAATRAKFRRSLRDLSELTLDWADSIDQALQFYEELIDYHQQRWNADGKPGAFCSKRFRNFHRDLITAWIPRGRAALVRVRANGRVIGVLYLLIEENRLLYYQSGLPEHQSKLSLGNVTHYATMLEGARRGYDAYDFMGGDAQHKRVLSTNHNTLYWARWRKPSVKFLLLEGLRTIKNCLKLT